MGITQEVRIDIRTGVEVGLDGGHWVAVELALGLVVTKLLMPEETARKLATILPDAIVQTADAAKRANLGLIVLGNGQGPPVDVRRE